MIGRAAYNEPYVALPMRSRVATMPGPERSVEYQWNAGNRRDAGWCRLRVEAPGSSEPIAPLPESEACFVTEHYWGYTRQRDGATVEYEVEHAPWRVWPVTAATLDGDLAPFYGDTFAKTLATTPCSACLAEGSAVKVFWPRRL
jgi:uncharacterized protein YqjF (DUF2071 family)